MGRTFQQFPLKQLVNSSWDWYPVTRIQKVRDFFKNDMLGGKMPGDILAENVSRFTLASAFIETKPFIGFIATIRGNNQLKYSLPRRKLNELFENTLWVDQKKPGHRKWQHPVTHIVVEYVARKKRIDPGAIDGVVLAIQIHINILGNDIFGFARGGWTKAFNSKDSEEGRPDYVAAEDRYQTFVVDPNFLGSRTEFYRSLS